MGDNDIYNPWSSLDVHTIVDKMNPWAGLASYEDPLDGAPKHIFCGRDDEIFDVVRLIDDSFFVTLYGKSGIGKTSLLNAGVFPKLRRMQYAPLSIRLGVLDESIIYQDVITDTIEKNIISSGGSIRIVDVIPLQYDRDANDYLWNYFTRRVFYNKDGFVVFPVVVLDQFEELLRKPSVRCKGEKLLTQIGYLIDENNELQDCTVNGYEYTYDYNFRFILSIREDYLYRLEDSIDNCYLAPMKRYRYRLRSLSRKGAREAVLIPGKDVFLEKDKDAIADAVIATSINGIEGDISTNILSLVCSSIYSNYISSVSDSDKISLHTVQHFISGNPFEKFYDEATQDLSGRELAYIERHLVDSGGNRDSVSESDFMLHVHNGAVLLEGPHKILQRTYTGSGGYRIELIHDSFCEPLAALKTKREKRQRTIFLFLAIGVAVACAFTASFMSHQNDEIKRNLARFVADKASTLTNDGDSYLSMRLISALISNKSNYTPEAEFALRKAFDANNATLYGHTQWVLGTDMSPDGRYIVSSSRDKSVRLWDAVNGLQVALLEGHTDMVNYVEFSPDGQWIVTASSDSTARIWDFGTLQVAGILKGHGAGVKKAAFSPDGTMIATACQDDTVRLWRMEDCSCLMKLAGHTSDVNGVAFSPNGRRLVSVSNDGTLRMWSVPGGLEIMVRDVQANWLNDVTYSPDGRMIAVACDDSTARVLDARTGVTINVKDKVHTSYVRTARFSHNSKYLVTTSSDNTVCLWDAKTDTCYQIFKGHSDWVNMARFSPNDKMLYSASSDNTIRIWNLSKDVSMMTFVCCPDDVVLHACYRPDGLTVAAASKDGNVMLLDPANGTAIVRKDYGVPASAVAFNNKGDALAIVFDNGDLRIVNSNSLQDSLKLGDPLHAANDVAWSPDDGYVSVATVDGEVIIYDLITLQCIRILRGHSGAVNAVAFSPDGQQIATASDDATARVWDNNTGDMICEYSNHSDRVEDIAFSYDGKSIATASADNEVHLWNTLTGECIHAMIGHTRGAYGVCFSPDGHYLASSSSDMSLRVWHIETGKEIYRVLAHARRIYSVAFNFDGTNIITASKDGTCKVWNFMAIDSLKENVEQRFHDVPLSENERKQFYIGYN